MKHLLFCILITLFSASMATANTPNDLPAEASEAVAEDLAVAEALKTVEENQKAVKAELKKESEIPLKLNEGKKASEQESPLMRLLVSALMMGILGAGAFYLIRKRTIPNQLRHQTQIKVLQQHYLGPKKSLAIVRVAGESILIGITDQNITHLKSLSLLDDEIPAEVPQRFDTVVQGMQGMGQDVGFEGEGEGEDFTFGGIKDAVSRKLRNMRNIE